MKLYATVGARFVGDGQDLAPARRRRDVEVFGDRVGGYRQRVVAPHVDACFETSKEPGSGVVDCDRLPVGEFGRSADGGACVKG